MSVMDPGDSLSDAEIQRALGALARAGVGSSPRVRRGYVRIKNRPRKPDKKNKTHLLELGQGVGLNQTIKIEVELPAYLVAGSGWGDRRNEFIREAIKEKLAREGKALMWQPRFMAVLKAREIEARNRFTRKSR